MQKLIAKFLKEESGATAAEYALLVAVVGAGIVTAVKGLDTSISTGLSGAGTCITAKTC
jgi:pilus assembly protein Flp/PilA